MRIRLICVLILFLAAANTALANDSEVAWPIEERCVNEATQPPDSWTFEGLIIADGWGGIHGMRGEWDVPHVLAFRDGWISEGGYGTVSPDGRWYAVPQAAFRPTADILRGYVDVTQLLVYDLHNSENSLRIDWRDTYEVFFGSAASRYYTFRTPVWFDEDTIIYQRGEAYYFVHVPDLEVEEWATPSEWQNVSPTWVFISHPSPDWSRIVVRTRLFDSNKNEIIEDVYSPTANIDLPSVAWRPDSAEFLISGALSTSLYDTNGDLLDVVSLASDGAVNNHTYVDQNAYSPNGENFWLTYYSEQPDLSLRQNLALADRSNRTIIDTCIDTSSLTVHFSPDGRYIALLSFERGQQELLILDIEDWQLYQTGNYHEGRIIGWRAD